MMIIRQLLKTIDVLLHYFKMINFNYQITNYAMLETPPHLFLGAAWVL